MGNHNSGRSGRSSGVSVESCQALDASRLTREGVLRDGIVRLEVTSSWSSGEQSVIFVEKTLPNFGGTRWWLQCPMCTRRVRKLYVPPRRKYFACRNCYRLTYRSRSDCRDGQYCRRAQKIYRRLGGDFFSDSIFPPKPKGMWTRTYERLRQRAQAAEAHRRWRVARAHGWI